MRRERKGRGKGEGNARLEQARPHPHLVLIKVVHFPHIQQRARLAVVHGQALWRALLARLGDVARGALREEGRDEVVGRAVLVEEGGERDRGGREGEGREEEVAGEEDKVGLRAGAEREESVGCGRGGATRREKERREGEARGERRRRREEGERGERERERQREEGRGREGAREGREGGQGDDPARTHRDQPLLRSPHQAPDDVLARHVVGHLLEVDARERVQRRARAGELGAARAQVVRDRLGERRGREDEDVCGRGRGGAGQVPSAEGDERERSVP